MRLIFARQRIATALVLALGIVAVACSGGDSSSEPAVTLSLVEARGEKLFRGEGCSACHRTNSSRLVGPGLAGIRHRGDDAYIRESIRDPGAVVVDGYNNVMSNFSGLSDAELDDLLAYLKTLE